jgi:hypothetical protein
MDNNQVNKELAQAVILLLSKQEAMMSAILRTMANGNPETLRGLIGDYDQSVKSYRKEYKEALSEQFPHLFGK